MIGQIAKRFGSNQQGFALITAVMMLFVAMVLGLMVADSSNIEIMLSGAQQRYEDSFNTTEGGAGVEATAIGRGDVITWGGNDRDYAVVNPTIPDQILSPTAPTDPMFDPGGDMGSPGAYTVVENTSPALWPTDNLLHSANGADDLYDYQYRVIYRNDDVAPKGFDATDFTSYLFEISAQRGTLVEMGGNKVGPKSL